MSNDHLYQTGWPFSFSSILLLFAIKPTPVGMMTHRFVKSTQLLFLMWRKKDILALRWVKNFIPNLNHLLVLAYPENLSSIGLMVEAVDTFRGASASAVPVRCGAVRCWCQVWLYRKPQPNRILALSWAELGWAGLGSAWLGFELRLRFVNIYYFENLFFPISF